MSEYTFDTPRPLEVHVEVPAGNVDVRCEETTSTQVHVESRHEELADRTTVRLDGGRLRIEAPTKRFGLSFGSGSGVNISVTVPVGSRLVVKTASADLHCHGELGGLAVVTASGDITADQVDGDATVQTASGDVNIGAVSGQLSVKGSSSDLSVEHVDRLMASTASGDMTVGTLTGQLIARSASGDVRVVDAAGSQVSVTTVSGEIEVAVRPGTALKLELFSRSGSVRSQLQVEELPPEGDLSLDLRLLSTSGDILVRRATQPATPQA
jgi:DUF4097 and DUF4098 domain-containing protein YvlB